MVMRKYIECDTYSSLSVQTDDTLADYDSTIQQFGIRLAVRSNPRLSSSISELVVIRNIANAARTVTKT